MATLCASLAAIVIAVLFIVSIVSNWMNGYQLKYILSLLTVTQMHLAIVLYLTAPKYPYLVNSFTTELSNWFLFRYLN